MSGVFLIAAYGANILIAGIAGGIACVSPKWAAATLFNHQWRANGAHRLVGAFWLSIALLSVLGLFDPYTYSPVLLIQFIYKSLWLLACFSSLFFGSGSKREIPPVMTAVFLLWVLVLPLVIPWDFLFQEFSVESPATSPRDPP